MLEVLDKIRDDPQVIPISIERKYGFMLDCNGEIRNFPQFASVKAKAKDKSLD